MPGIHINASSNGRICHYKRLVRNVHRPVAGNGRLIAGYRSISDRSYRMVSLGYVSQDLATSGSYRLAARKFMVMFLQFAQRQKHCCLSWHQSLTSCRCGCRSRSQLYLSPPVPEGRTISFCDNVNVIAVILST